jgi:hypothetical protein
MVKRKIIDDKVFCPIRESFVYVEDCEQCPMFGGKVVDEKGRWVICHL